MRVAISCIISSLVAGCGTSSAAQPSSAGASSQAQALPSVANRSRFDLQERTYICISAKIDPRAWPSDYTAEAAASVSNSFLDGIETVFNRLGIASNVPGDTVGDRFTYSVALDPRCAVKPENIYVDIELRPNKGGRSFILSYSARQQGRTFSKTVSRDPEVEGLISRTPPFEILAPALSEIAREVKLQGIYFGLILASVRETV